MKIIRDAIKRLLRIRAVPPLELYPVADESGDDHGKKREILSRVKHGLRER